MNRLQKYPRLLPHRFKAIGLLIALSGFLYLALIITLKLGFDYQVIGSKDIHFNICIIIMLIGFGMRTMSREKDEDELIMQIRLRSMAGTFFGAGGFALAAAAFAMSGNSMEWPIQYFVMWEFGMYQFFFWNEKKQYFKQNS